MVEARRRTLLCTNDERVSQNAIRNLEGLVLAIRIQAQRLPVSFGVHCPSASKCPTIKAQDGGCWPRRCRRIHSEGIYQHDNRRNEVRQEVQEWHRRLQRKLRPYCGIQGQVDQFARGLSWRMENRPLALQGLWSLPHLACGKRLEPCPATVHPDVPS